MKNFDKTKHLNDIKEQDSLNIYQDKDVELEPWISSSILKSIKTKNIYYKKFLKSQSKLWYDRYENCTNIPKSLRSKNIKKNI